MNRSEERDSNVTSLCLAGAAIVLGIALYLNGGFYDTRALLLVTFALILCVLAVALRGVQRADALVHRITLIVLTAGLAFQSYRLLRDSNHWLPVILTLLGIAAVLILKRQAIRIWWVGLVLMIAFLLPHFLIGLFAIRGLANPNFDVYLCHMQSLEALLKGINPHTLTIGYSPGNEVNYPASYVFGGRVHIGFPYPPLSLFLALPGYLLGGDYRYSSLAATTLSGFFIAFARPSKLSFLAAAVFLTTPAIIPVLRMGWTEPLVVLLFTVTVFCACRAPRLLPFALGLLFAVKQYAILAGLAVCLLPLEPKTLKSYAILVGKALLVATALTLPWMLWNVTGFLHDVVWLQFQLPFRMDALSYLVWITYNTGVQLPAVVGFVMMAPAIALVAWRGAHTPAGFGAAVAFIFLSFFAFNKTAFINYYFFVIGAMCCAVAVTGESGVLKAQAPLQSGCRSTI